MGELGSCVDDFLVSLGHGRSCVLESVRHVSKSRCDIALCVRAGARTWVSCSTGSPSGPGFGKNTPSLTPSKDFTPIVGADCLLCGLRSVPFCLPLWVFPAFSKWVCPQGAELSRACLGCWQDPERWASSPAISGLRDLGGAH